MTRVRAFVAVIGLVIVAPASAQAPFRTRTDLVALNVTVLDDKGVLDERGPGGRPRPRRKAQNPLKEQNFHAFPVV